MKKFGTLVLLALAVAPQTGFGHARFRLNGTTPPRNTSTGLKSGPCGGIARTNTPVVLTAGNQLVVQWEQTVNHPGFYRISFSPANDAGFDLNTNILVPKFDNVVGQQFFQTTIAVPNMNCTGCTLQLIQYMTETNPPSLYYSCADIEIKGATVTPSPTPTVTGTPTPTPTATGNCAK